MIDTRLETFLTLCKVMNYRRTAELLNMTQPAVTQHIHYLEDYYGCKLFVYDRRSLKMTEKAALLKKYAENVMYQEKKLRAALDTGDAVSLSVGATKTIGEYVLGEHISAFLQEQRNRVSVNVDNTEKLLGLLSAGELDFALVEGAFDRSRYAAKLYRTEPFVGLCGAGHPFAGHDVSLDELLRENLILREEGSGTRNILEQLLGEYNYSAADFGRVTTVSSFGLISRLLEKGAGVTFAFRAVGEQNDRLAEFTVQGRNISREFNYVYLDTPYAANAVQYFDKYK